METKKPQITEAIPAREDGPYRRGRRRISGSRRGFFDKFNRRQNRVLIASAVLLALLILFPPWLYERANSDPTEEFFAGWRLLFTPPDGTEAVLSSKPRLDYMMLGVELAGFLALSFGCFRAMADRR